MTADFRALCARLADKLDAYRKMLLDDRNVTHRLADEARAALAEPEPLSLKELALEALNQADKGLNESEWQQRSDTIRQALEQLDD